MPMTFIASPTMKAAVLDERTRVRAVGQLSDQLRERGGNYHHTLTLIQAIFREAKMPEPDEATIDGWLYEADHG